MAVGINVVVGFVAGSVKLGSEVARETESSGELTADLNYIGGAVWFDTATGFFDMDRIPLGLAYIGWKNVLGTMDGWWVANDFIFFFFRRSVVRRIGIPMNYGFGMIGFDMGF